MPGMEWDTIETTLQWLGIVSLFTFFVSLAFIPWLISRLPVDYFVRPHRFRHPFSAGAGLLFPVWFVFRNIAGVVVLLAGTAMLFLPGQGILTIILGVALMSFPAIPPAFYPDDQTIGSTQPRLDQDQNRSPEIHLAVGWASVTASADGHRSRAALRCEGRLRFSRR